MRTPITPASARTSTSAIRRTAPILKKRLGDVAIETADYGEVLTRNGVEISLHPAGHVLGSAQVRVALRGEVWVASGDYKTEADGVVAAFEPQRCNVFITESTFALPIYRWRPQSAIIGEIEGWWRENAAAGRASVLYAYALGKAQRVLARIDASIGPIVCHGAVEPINAIYREAGVAVAADAARHRDHGQTRLCGRADRRAADRPPGSAWLNRFGDYSDALASGWMQVRGNRRRRGLDRGFALSDHADWPGLLAAIAATGAERVLATHGSAAALARFLTERGLDAGVLATAYGGDDDEPAPVAA